MIFLKKSDIEIGIGVFYSSNYVMFLLSVCGTTYHI